MLKSPKPTVSATKTALSHFTGEAKTDTPRTILWGVDNQTNESIEIAFGQLIGYEVPDYATNTGVVTLIAGGAPGQGALRDPLLDTNGLPIAAYYYSVSAKVNGQDLYAEDEAPEGNYFPDAVMVIEYGASELSTADNPKVEIRIVLGSAKKLNT